MEYGSGSVQCLQFILDIQCIVYIGGIVNRKVGGIGIVRSISRLTCSLDARPTLSVVLCKTVCRTFRRSSLQVVKITVLFLIIGQTLSHVIQYFLGELLRLCTGHIFS